MKHSKLLIIAHVTDNPYESTSILEWTSFFLVWSCSSIQWSVVTHVGTWGVSYPILFHLYIYICPCFRSLFIVPGSQTKRLAHPEYPLHRHDHGIRVATCGHVEGISHHSFDIGFGVHQRMGYVPWRLKEPKSWKNEESMEPNDQPLFWGWPSGFWVESSQNTGHLGSR